MAEKRPLLLVMRLADMRRTHPKQITSHCARCGEEVGIYPSGQQVIKEIPNVEVVCQVCRPEDADVGLPAPGAIAEAFNRR